MLKQDGSCDSLLLHHIEAQIHFDAFLDALHQRELTVALTDGSSSNVPVRTCCCVDWMQAVPLSSSCAMPSASQASCDDHCICIKEGCGFCVKHKLRDWKNDIWQFYYHLTEAQELVKPVLQRLVYDPLHCFTNVMLNLLSSCHTWLKSQGYKAIATALKTAINTCASHWPKKTFQANIAKEVMVSECLDHLWDALSTKVKTELDQEVDVLWRPHVTQTRTIRTEARGGGDRAREAAPPQGTGPGGPVSSCGANGGGGGRCQAQRGVVERATRELGAAKGKLAKVTEERDAIKDEKAVVEQSLKHQEECCSLITQESERRCRSAREEAKRDAARETFAAERGVLEKMAQSMKDELANLQSQLAKSDEENGALKVKVGGLEGDVAHRNDELAQAQDSYQQLTKEFESLMTSKKKADDTVIALNSKAADNDEEIKKLACMQTQLQKENTLLKEQNSQMSRKITALQAEKSHSKDELVKAHQKYHDQLESNQVKPSDDDDDAAKALSAITSSASVCAYVEPTPKKPLFLKKRIAAFAATTSGTVRHKKTAKMVVADLAAPLRSSSAEQVPHTEIVSTSSTTSSSNRTTQEFEVEVRQTAADHPSGSDVGNDHENANANGGRAADDVKKPQPVFMTPMTAGTDSIILCVEIPKGCSRFGGTWPQCPGEGSSLVFKLQCAPEKIEVKVKRLNKLMRYQVTGYVGRPQDYFAKPSRTGEMMNIWTYPNPPEPPRTMTFTVNWT
ncbi:hypothetical protein Pelo_3569 [Pelomyxa schiedti]|nr:hypothetical protein Pelo_3569 [Pelomyxa schiedti]